MSFINSQVGVITAPNGRFMASFDCAKIAGKPQEEVFVIFVGVNAFSNGMQILSSGIFFTDSDSRSLARLLLLMHVLHAPPVEGL